MRTHVLYAFILVDMVSVMSFSEKVAVLELLIECIRGHEARLGDLVQALENVAYVENVSRTSNVERHPPSW